MKKKMILQVLKKVIKLNFISYSKTEVDIPPDFHILNWIWLYRRNITTEICICTCKWSVFNLLYIHITIAKNKLVVDVTYFQTLSMYSLKIIGKKEMYKLKN